MCTKFRHQKFLTFIFKTKLLDRNFLLITNKLFMCETRDDPLLKHLYKVMAKSSGSMLRGYNAYMDIWPPSLGSNLPWSISNSNGWSCCVTGMPQFARLFHRPLSRTTGVNGDKNFTLLVQVHV